MNIFFDVVVGKSELEFFKNLPSDEKVTYLMDIYNDELLRSEDEFHHLGEFFDDINNELEDYEINQEPYIPQHESDNVSRVDVMIDERNILIESNSLKAVRYTKYKLAEAGYILNRDKKVEKLYKDSKKTKYLRIFKIVDKTAPLCLN